MSEIICPLCYGMHTRFFGKHPKVGQRLHHCEACGFYFADPHIPYVHSEHTEVEKDAVAGYWANREAIDHYLAWREAENARLAQWVLDVIEPGRVLEVGVGDGPLSRLLAPRVSDYWGIEPDVNAVERARALIPEGDRRILQIGSQEVETTPPISQMLGTFDAVLLVSVLEHIPQPRAFLATARRLLKPEGRLVISVPSSERFRLFYRLRRLMGMEPWTYFHISFFRLSNLEKALAAEGFSLETKRRHSLLCRESIAYFEERYRARMLGHAMRAFAGLGLDRLTDMTTLFLVARPTG